MTRIRSATSGDVCAINGLFNALIASTTVAWRDDPATLDETRAWFVEQRRQQRPVLVGEQGGVVVGHTCWSPFRGGPRFPGYRYSAEHTIHVDADHRGRGVGRTLLTALLDEARRRHIHVMVAGIDADNDASLAFHRALEFSEVARMPEVGWKFGRWLDLVLMQRILR